MLALWENLLDTSGNRELLPTGLYTFILIHTYIHTYEHASDDFLHFTNSQLLSRRKHVPTVS